MESVLSWQASYKYSFEIPNNKKYWQQFNL